MVRVFVVFMLIVPLLVRSQPTDEFKPLHTQPKNPAEIKRRLNQGLIEEISSIPRDTLNLIKSKYEKSLNSIYKGIDKGKFIWSDTLTELVERVLYKLTSHNPGRSFNPVILIANTPVANAMCLPSGAIVITIGLLGRITTEDQLAFVIAHELQHHYLKHTRRGFYIQQKIKSTAKLESTMKEILNGGEPVEEIMELKELFYETAEISRKREIEADINALTLMEFTKYNPKAAIEALDLLELGLCSDSLQSIDFFQQLNSPKYPFQAQWISQDYKPTERSKTMFFFDKDSLKSHPETNLRKQEMYKHFMSAKSHTDGVPVHIEATTRIALYQIVKSAYDEHYLDVALYQALSLANTYGLNDYLIEHIGKILITTSNLKQNPWTSSYFYTSRYGFCKGLQQTNNLLRTISTVEAGEILFQFMNQSKHFDRENELHYFLIWQACGLTPRVTTGEKIREQYLKKFPKGQYKKDMK